MPFALEDLPVLRNFGETQREMDKQRFQSRILGIEHRRSERKGCGMERGRAWVNWGVHAFLCAQSGNECNGAVPLTGLLLNG